MKFANATWFDSKSGVAQGRDLQFHFMEKRNPETTTLPLCPKAKLQVPPLRCAPVGMTNLRVTAHLGRSGGGWTEHNSNQPAFVCPRSLQRIRQVAQFGESSTHTTDVKVPAADALETAEKRALEKIQAKKDSK
jgi:hypothetical protein